MAEHLHGSMPIKDHEKTFASFVRMVIWAAGIAIGTLIFLALVNA